MVSVRGAVKSPENHLLAKACSLLFVKLILHTTELKFVHDELSRVPFPGQVKSAPFGNGPQQCRLTLRLNWTWRLSCPIGGGPPSHTACMGCWCIQATLCILATTLPLSRHPMACGTSWMTIMSARWGLSSTMLGHPSSTCCCPVLASVLQACVCTTLALDQTSCCSVMSCLATGAA